MQMSEVLDRLKSLQEVLAEKYDIEAKVEELPKSLVGSTESLERFKAEYIEKNKVYETKKQEVANLRLQLEEAEKAREAGEKGMDSIQTHREYEVLDKQIAEATEKETQIRKELQKEEKALSELKDNLDSDEAFIAATEKDVNEAKDTLSQEIDGYKTQLDQLAEKEAAMSEGIESEIIFKFQRIIQRNRVGIVPVKGNVCEGCHMVLPHQYANEIHRGEKILFCPYCSSLLYYEETVDDDSNYFSLDEAGSLADLDDEEDIFDDEEDIMDGEGSSEDDSSDDVKGLDYED